MPSEEGGPRFLTATATVKLSFEVEAKCFFFCFVILLALIENYFFSPLFSMKNMQVWNYVWLFGEFLEPGP